jgi:hypothetical protein
MTSPQFHETQMGGQHYAMLERNLGRIATALEKLVELNDNSDHLGALQDEAEEMLGAPGDGDPHVLFKNLTPEEEGKFRKWARDNYQPREEVSPVWHWVVRDECDKINEELDEEGQVK